jgi:hypothetical protein
MQVVDQTGSTADSAFRMIRFLAQILTFLAALLACRWGMRSFLFGRKSRLACGALSFARSSRETVDRYRSLDRAFSAVI